MDSSSRYSPIIVGGGIAGLLAAIEMAPRPVLIVAARPLGEMCSSALAQGGLAAAVDAQDSPALHAQDTLKAGAGLCDSEVVATITGEGQRAIERLISLQVAFDRHETGALALSLEGAHSCRRVVHAYGDSSGLMIMRALIRAARATPSISMLYGTAVRILAEEGEVRGLAIRQGFRERILPTNELVLATGGAGGLWRCTTNPLMSQGAGIALAALVGATLADLEFMQFHPTAIDVGTGSLPLASEALRGEGAILVNEDGERFMSDYPLAELEPRDIVTRAIWQQLQSGHLVYLDARKALGQSFSKRFPSVTALCHQHGIDPVSQPIPVRPCAHYHMGGVETDLRGRAGVKGLWACGEVACTGLHGANRLASNSLLEAVVMGTRVGQDISGRPAVQNAIRHNFAHAPRDSLQSKLHLALPRKRYARVIRDIMQNHVGVVRDKESLSMAIKTLNMLRLTPHEPMALTSRMIALAAFMREESRGAHYRKDFSAPSANWVRRQKFKLSDMELALQGLMEKP